MKTTLLAVTSFLFLMPGCDEKAPAETRKIIAVSILPQKFFVEQIAGDKFQIEVMIPPGASPATYEPSPKQLSAITGAYAYFKIGHIEFEKAWDTKFRVIHKNLEFFDNSKNISLIEADDHGHHHGADPHIWMSVKNVKIISENLVNNLISLDGDNEEYYSKNYESFIQRLDSIDQWVEVQLENRKRSEFLIFHPALTYYARDYGLEQISLELEGKQPSPSHMKSLSEQASGAGIKHVFIQKQFDTENAETIARQLDAEIVEIDPLDENWEKQIKEITNKLTMALN